MNLTAQFKEFLLNQTNPSSRITIKNYVSDLNRFINWFSLKFNKEFSPSGIDLGVIELFKKDLLNTHSASSIERNLSSLRKFFYFLKLEGQVSHSPFEPAASSQQPAADPWRIRDFKNNLYVFNAAHLTIKNYIIDVKQFINWAEQALIDPGSWENQDSSLISRITPQIIEEYKKRLLSEMNLSPVSVNRKLSSLRKYFSWANSEGLLREQIAIPNMRGAATPLRSSSFEGRATGLPAEALAKEGPRAYSKLPPLRLIQKSKDGLVNLFDGIVTYPLAEVKEKIDLALWAQKGRPVFAKIKKQKSLPRRQAGKIKNSRIGNWKPALPTGRLEIGNYPKEFYAPTQISTTHFPLHRKALHHLKHTRPNWYKRYQSYSFVRYFQLAILMLFVSVLGYAIYSNINPKKPQPKTLAALPSAPPRVLSFQGRLTDAQDNPITATTSLRMGIYSNPTSSGSALLWQEVISPTPDEDGIFNVILGKGTAIPQSLFAENSALYLGVTVGQTPELKPRQQIATVAFAANAETLQGLPPITAGSATSNVVLALNSSGNLTIGGTASPVFQATGGNFTVSGKTLTLSTVSGTGGNVVIAPDGNGIIDVQKALQNTSNTGKVVPGAVEVHDVFAILATTSSQAAFNINQGGTNNLITASVSGITRFFVGNSGAIYSGGNLEIDGGSSDIAGTLNLSGSSLTSTGNLSISATGYTRIADTATPTNASGDDDLFVESDLEVDGVIYAEGTIDTLFTGNNAAVYGTTSTGVLASATTSTTGLCFVSGATTPSWNNCNSSGIDTFWNQTSGALFANNSTVDFLIGGQSSASAKFSVLNIATGTPTASISANSGDIATYLTGLGNLQTTNGQTLTLGGSTTGNITLSPNNGSGGIVNVNSPTINTSATSLALFNTTATTVNFAGAATTLNLGASTGTATIANAALTLSNATTLTASSLTLITGGATAIDFTEFDVNASTGSITINDGGDLGSVTVEGSVFDINSLDFADVGLITTGGTTDLTLNPTDEVVLGDTDNIVIGGHAGAVAYNVISDSGGGTSQNLASDDDLYIEGDLEVDGTAYFDGAITGASTASISGNLTLAGAARSIQTTANNTLTIGGDTTGNIAISPNNGGAGSLLTVNSLLMTLAGTTTITASSLATFTTAASLAVTATTLTLGNGSAATIATTTNGLTLDSGSNTLTIASSDTTLTASGITTISLGTSATINAGATALNLQADGTPDVNIAGGSGTTGCTILNASGNLTCSGAISSTSTTGTQGWWTVTSGAIFPTNSTLDFLIGGQSSAAAKFAVLNVNSGTPTASISANSGNNATYLTGTGSLQTVLNNTLTLGGDTTGNIAISPNNGGAGSLLTVNSLLMTLAGTTTLTGTSLTSITGGATAIDFTEFDVSASTGEITINDTGDLGKITIEGTALDINSLDFTGAGTLTSGAGTNLTFTPGTTGDFVFSTDSDTVATFTGSAEGTANVTLTSGDLTITDGDLILSGGEISATADDSTGTSFSFTGVNTTGDTLGVVANSLTTGTALAVSSTATSFNGELLTLSKTGASGFTAFTSDIANITYSQTFDSGVALNSTGNVLDISRAITLNNTGNTHTISGALLTIADSGVETAGDISNTSNILSLAQNCGTGVTCSGAVFKISNSGTGADIALDNDETITNSADGTIAFGADKLTLTSTAAVSGTLFASSYAGATTQTGALTGISFDISTNMTVPNSSSGNQTGLSLTVKDGGASATAIGMSISGTSDRGIDLSGLTISSGGSIIYNDASSTIDLAAAADNVLEITNSSGTTTNDNIITLEIDANTDASDKILLRVVSEVGGSEQTKFSVDSDGDVIAGIISIVTDLTCTDCLDFTDFEDTLDLDANLTLNQTTNTWSQTFTGDTTVGLTYTANSLTTGTALRLTSTGTITSGGELLDLVGNSATSGNLITASGTALTSGSLLSFAGPSGGTVGITGSLVSLTSDVGNAGKMLSSTGTIDSTALSAAGYNIYASTTNSNATNANSAYGVYSTLSDAVALGNSDYGVYGTVSNTGANTLGTKSVYGVYGTSSNTSTGVGGSAVTYGGYFSATGDLGGTSTAYGIYATATGADTNYAAIFENGLVGIGITTPTQTLHVAGQCVTGDTLLKRRRRRKKGHSGDEDTESIESHAGDPIALLQDDDYIYEDVRIDHIQEGDEILTLDEKTGEFVPQKVEKLMDMGVQEVFELITRSGFSIRTTDNHPYLVIEKGLKKYQKLQRLTVFEVDQSMRVEDKTSDTILAIANIESSFITKLDKKQKQILFKEYSQKNHSKKFGFEIFAKMIIATIVKSQFIVTDLIIDTEYDKHEMEIAAIIRKVYPRIGISFRSVGKHSPAHLAAYETHIRRNMPVKKTKKEETLARSNLQGFRAAELLHPEFTGIRSPHGLLLYPDYTSKWEKVKYLKPGMTIATTNGWPEPRLTWEKISGIIHRGKEQTYDIQVANTHNFVGNDIVAHNTYINSTALTANIKGLEIDQSGAVTGTGYGLHVEKTGASTTNVAGYFSATGATNNYGLIVENGNVGIGTTTPTSQLHVTRPLSMGVTGKALAIFDQIENQDIFTASSSGTPVFSITTTQNGNARLTATGGHAQTLDFYSRDVSALHEGGAGPALIGAGAGGMVIKDDSTVHLTTGSNTGLYLDSSANVGIGNTVPLTALDVTGSASLSANLSLRGAATAHTFNILDNGTLNIQRSPGGDAGLATALFIQNNGNVGIGTTSPSDKLHIQDLTNASLRIEENLQTGASTPLIDLTSSQGTAGVRLSAIRDITLGGMDFALSVAANNAAEVAGTYTEALRVTRGGNVGIGTATLYSKLHIVSNRAYDDGAGFRIAAADTTTSNILFGFANTAGDYAGIQSYKDGTGVKPLLLNAMGGNVGIGTTTPTARLQVATPGGGNLYVSDYGCGAYAGLGGHSTLTGCANYALLTAGADTYINRPSGSAIRFREQNSEQMIIATGGNVGIGTTNPLSKLDVRGQAIMGVSGAAYLAPIASNAAEFNLSSNSLVTIGESITGNANPAVTLYRTSSGFRVGTAARMYLASSNFDFRIQQGTNNIDYGAEAYTDRLTINSSGNVGITGLLDPISSGTLSIGTGTNTSALTLGKAATTTTFNSTAWTATPTISGLITGSSGFNVTGGYGPTSLTTASSLKIGSGGGSPDAASLAWGDNTGWKLHFGTIVASVFTPRMTVVDTGNVGIGTTGPGFGIDVEKATGATYGKFGNTWPTYLIGGNPNVGFNTYYNGGFKFGKGSVANYAGTVTVNPTNGNWGFFTSDAGNADATATMTERLTILQGGNVGIGTTGPGYKLDVVGEIKSRLSTGDATGIVAGNAGSQLPYVKFTASDDSARFKLQMNGLNTSTERLSIYAGPLNATATTETLVVGGNGNVGIGTTAPNNKLSIVGVFSTGDDTLPALGANGGKFAVLNGGGSGLYGLLQGVLATGNVFLQAQRVDGTATAYNMFLQPNGGNVGIGNTTPLTALDVTGSASLSANLSLRGAATAHTFNILDNGTLNVQRSPGGDAGLATALFVQNNGNVGIGTTTPDNKLDVGGVIRGQSETLSGDVLIIGNDSKLVDIDVANTAGLYGGQDSTVGSLKLGSAGPTLAGTSGLLSITGNLTVSGTAWTATPTISGLITATSGFNVTGGYGPTSLTTASSLKIGSGGGSPDAASLAWGDNTGWKLHFGTIVASVFTPRMTIVDTGNVGIGTTAPASKLQITGDASASNNTTDRYFTIARPTTGGVSWAQAASFELGSYGRDGSCCGPNSQLDISLKAAGDNNEYGDTTVLSLQSGGNVGIGTTTPQSKTEIYSAGDGIEVLQRLTRISNVSPIPALGFEVTNGSESRAVKAGIGFERYQPNGGGALHFYNDDNTAGTSFVGNRASIGDIKMTIDYGGNVGIGTATPTQEKLVVSGGNILVGPLDAGKYISFYDNRYKITASSGLELHTGDYMRFLTVSNVERMRLDANGLLGLGTASPISELHVTRPLSFGATGKALAIFDQIENQDIFTASASGTNRFVIQNGGNVGIGTTAPGYKLQIDGTSATGTGGNTIADGLTIRSTSTINGVQLMHGSSTAFMALNTDTLGSGALGIGTKGSFPLHFYTNSGLTAGTPSTTGIRMTIDTAGNVGIGTTSPLGELHLSSTASTQFFMSDSNAAVDGKNWDMLADETTLVYRLVNDANSVATNYMTIERSGTTVTDVSFPNGNVGIGTTAPGYKLDVVGQIKSRLSTGDASGIVIGNNGSQQPQVQFNASDDSARFKLQMNGLNTSLERLSVYAGPINGTASTEAVVFGGNGNVGIGTTAPLTALDVTGSASLSANLSLRGAATAHTFNILDNGTLNIQRSPGGDAGLATALFVQNNGNVGIGTTAPVAKLQVTAGAGAGSMVIGNECAGNYTSISLNGGTPGTCGATYNILSSTTDTNLYINRPNGAAMHFREANSSQLTIAAGGNITTTGTINSQTISSAANFTGTLAVASTSTLTGNVGIGGAPSAVLDVKVATNRHIAVRDLGATAQLLAMTDGAAAYAAMLLDATTLTINGQTGGAVTMGGSLAITGALSGVTTLAMGGALTGVTTITTSGAINGQTISSAANFTGSLTLAGTLDPNGAVTLPTTGISGGGSGSGLDADTLDAIDSTQFAQSKVFASTDFNSETGYSGVSSINGVTNTPFGAAWYNLINNRHRGGISDGNVWGSQIATGMTGFTNRMAMRVNTGVAGTWTAWNEIWTAGSDGAGSGLDADLWDGNNFATYLNQAVLTTSSPTFGGITFGLGPTITDGTNQLVFNASDYSYFQTGTVYVQNTTVLRGNVIDDGGNLTFGDAVDISGALVTNSTVVMHNLGTPVDDKYVCAIGGVTDELRLKATSCTASSRRYKENIEELGYGLDEIMKLQPRWFNFKNWVYEPGDGTTKRRVGFIAEEVNDVIPEFINYDDLGLPVGVDYPVITSLLTKGIQQQQLQIASQSSRITTLESDLSLTDSGNLSIVSSSMYQELGIDPQSLNTEYGVLNTSNNEIIRRIGAFSEIVSARIRAGMIDAQLITTKTLTALSANFGELTTNSLAIATDNITIAGETLRDYIASIVDSRLASARLQGETLEANSVRANIISPLSETEDGKIAVKLNDNGGKSKLEIRNASGSAVASIDSHGNATFSGQIRADQLEISENLSAGEASISGDLRAKRIVADDLILSEEALIKLGASISAVASPSANSQLSMVNSQSSTSSAQQLSNVTIEQLTVTSGLMSFGPTSFFEASIADRLFVGSQLSLADNAINVLGSNLEIQPLRQGGIRFLSGLVEIDREGNLRVDGNAYFAKDIKVEGKLYANIIAPIPGKDLVLELASSDQRLASSSPKFAINNASHSAILTIDSEGNISSSGAGTFSKLNLNIVGEVEAISDTEAIATGSAGLSAIRAYQNELTIRNPLVNEKSLIYITPKASTGASGLYLMRQAPGVSFTVGLDQIQNKDIQFNWIIIN